VSLPAVSEANGESRELTPHEARLRSLTYAAPLYIDVSSKQYQLDEKRNYHPDDEPVRTKEFQHEFLGYLPIMLRCQYCTLNPGGKGLNDRDLTRAGECVFDQGGYFIINGSEKVST
jgi:DNA-directed RNA polymerase II subunit RPB2